jgi:hypothetical protein
MGDQAHLASLQLRAAMAEATARLVAAEQAAALGRRTQNTFWQRENWRTLSPGTVGPGHGRRPAPLRDNPHLTWLAWCSISRTGRPILNRQPTNERRRGNKQQQTGDAQRETQHAAQLAALLGSPPTGGHPSSFIPNKGFSEIKPFSGARGQDLLPWLQQFRSWATFLKTSAEDVARELCLTLTGDALQAYNQRFTLDATPTFEEVAAQLARTFIKPYQGAAQWST